MGLARRFEGVVAFPRHPVVLQVMPGTAQREGVDRAGMPVPRQDARLPDLQQVDVEPLRDAKDQRLEPDPRRLRYPFPLIIVKVQRPAEEDVRHHPERLRLLIGDPARVLASRGGACGCGGHCAVLLAVSLQGLIWRMGPTSSSTA